ncbi:hypothetical protein Tco_0740155 [Tanacetum coccineum]
MASLDRRLNPLYAIKECSSCGNLHTKDCGCSKRESLRQYSFSHTHLSPMTPKIENFLSRIVGDPGNEASYTISGNRSGRIINIVLRTFFTIPRESEGIPDSVCDVPLCNNPTPLKAFKEHSETIIDSNNDYSSSDDDSYENIDYVDASPPDAEIVSLEVVEIVIPEVEDIYNPTSSSDFVIKSPSTFPNSFLEEINTFDNSSPESETFCFDLEENSSGSTTTVSIILLPDYEAFYSS